MTDNLHLSVSSDDAARPPDPDPPHRRARFSQTLRLKAALAVALLAVAGLAVAMYLDHRQTDEERAVSAAIEAYTAAWNAHDHAALRAAMAPSASFAAGESLEHPLVTVAVAGPEFERLIGSLFRASVSLTTVGPVTPVVERFWRATVPQRYRYEVHGLKVVENGVSLYTLVDIDGTLKVAQHVWWRPLAPQSPSMLWAV
jgi:hypothetical protein